MSKKSRAAKAAKEEEQATVKKSFTVEAKHFLEVLIVFGILWRFTGLDSKPLWLDEASTYTLSRGTLENIWAIGFYGDNNPPLFHYLTHFMLTFGNSEFILRFLPALFGVATIPVMYYIGKEIKDENVGLIAAALTTFSPFCLFYSQEAYSYSMVLFVSSLVILYYLKALKTNTTKNWIIFGLLSALAFWTHFYTFVPLLVMYAHAAIVYRKDILTKNVATLKNFAYALIVTAVAASPVVYMAVYRFMTLASKPVTYGVLGMALIPETIVRFSGFNWMLAFLFMFLLMIGLVYLYIQKDKSMFLLSLMFITLPIIISVILSSKMTMNPKYLIYLLPVIFVTIACCYGFIENLTKTKLLISIIIVMIGVINAAPTVDYLNSQKGEDWRGYATKLSQATSEGDIVVTVPGYVSTPLDYYYNNKTDGTIEIGADSAAALESAVSQKTTGKVYFVVTGDINAANPQGDAVQWLETKSVALGQYYGIYTFSV